MKDSSPINMRDNHSVNNGTEVSGWLDSFSSGPLAGLVFRVVSHLFSSIFGQLKRCWVSLVHFC